MSRLARFWGHRFSGFTHSLSADFNRRSRPGLPDYVRHGPFQHGSRLPAALVFGPQAVRRLRLMVRIGASAHAPSLWGFNRTEKRVPAFFADLMKRHKVLNLPSPVGRIPVGVVSPGSVPERFACPGKAPKRCEILGDAQAAFVNRTWPTLILRFGPPAGPTILPCPTSFCFP